MFKQISAACIALLTLNGAAAAQDATPPSTNAQTDPVPSTTAQPATPPTTDSQAAAAREAVAKALAERTCPLPAIANTAPLDPVAGSSLVTVPMAINGDKKEFLLDIGFKKPPEVSPELRAELGLPQVYMPGQGISAPPGMNFGGGGFTNVIVHDARNGVGIRQEDIVGASSLEIGRAKGEHLKFLVGERWKFEQSAFEGSLTGDFFRQYDVELDFADKQINWLTPTKCTDAHQVVFWAHTNVAILPVTIAPDGRYQMQATVKGHTINIELDTSSEHSVMRRDIADLDVGLKSGPPDMIPDGDRVDGRHMPIYVHNFPELIFAGGAILALNVPVRIQDYSMRPAFYREAATGHRDDQERIPDFTMGMDLLKFLHLYIVPAQGKVYVTAAHEELSPED
jgi:hypothetical protein